MNMLHFSDIYARFNDEHMRFIFTTKIMTTFEIHKIITNYVCIL